MVGEPAPLTFFGVKHAGFRLLRTLPWFLAAALALVFAVAAAGYTTFTLKRTREYGVAPPALAVSNDTATLARGEHLAHTLGGCAKCHGEDFGGQVMSDEPVMRLVAPNLTPGRGSAVRDYVDRDWARAILHGVGPDSRSLMVMPSKELSSFADDDIAAIVSFMKTVPAVDRELGRTDVKLLGRVVFGLTAAPVLSAEGYDHSRRRRTAPAADGSRAHGEYLSGICRGCHGPDLRGGVVLHPGAPPAADISPQAMALWDYPAFERALRTGIGRDGHVLNEAMPWRAMQGLTAEELRALWLGLRQDKNDDRLPLLR